ncbi:molybdenum cofactor guanylyltransferase MobA [uncultured Neptuniibacter sp.]|uniref:molybdenum cofactor guanylyltransferase MobA n=1 Tax=uncultured Neptuniibacter sp. TaxID=502143 RepID=UPI00262B0002|nr:molybdenum cofactor guanylyltransferase MobA [uncultured Neptuniibacter sp.]
MTGSDQFSLAAVVLAGGQGSRMLGEDKGLVLFRQKPMAHWILQKLAPVVDQLFISCNRNELRYRQFGFPTLADQIPGYPGPLAGVQAAMHCCVGSYTHLMVMPCDTPLIASAALEMLRQKAEENPASIVILSDDNRSHYLHAVIPVAFHQDLEERLRSGQRAVYRWYRQYPVIEVDVSALGQGLMNINTPQQLAVGA